MTQTLRMLVAILAVTVGLALRALGQAPAGPGPGEGGNGAIATLPGGGAAASNLGGAADAFAAGKQIVADAQPKGAIIRLDAEVDKMMTSSVKRRVDLAAKAGCTVLIFEIDTFGGAVTDAITISELIKGLATQKFITVAWVHHKAISAGSMIAASCQHIVTSASCEFGDCAPIGIISTPLGAEVVPLDQTARKKQESAVLGEFLDSAQKNHWNEDAIKAMVVLQAQLHELRNNLTGQTVYVGDDKKKELLDQQVDGPGGPGAPKIHPWQFVSTLDGPDSLYTMSSSEEALKVGMSQATIDNEQQLKDVCNIRGDLLVLPYSWAENATIFLTDWYIRGLLFVGMLVFGVLEFSHPGSTIFGIAALLCLVLLVGAPFLTGLAQIWEIALIVVGLAIIVTDLLVFGGIGLLALPGFILMAIGLIASFVPADGSGFLSTTRAWHAAATGMGVVVGGTFLAAIFFYFATKYLALTPGFRRLQLQPGGRRGATAAVVAAGAEAVRDSADRPAGDAVFVGAIGIAASDLRPSGNARFGEHTVGVVSYGSFIPRGAELEVLEISGARIVVRPHTIS